MPGLELSDEALTAALRAHPELRERVSSIVVAVEGDAGELKEADAAEERLVEEMRLLGREALRGWAENRVAATEREIRGDEHAGRRSEITARDLVVEVITELRARRNGSLSCVRYASRSDRSRGWRTMRHRGAPGDRQGAGGESPLR